MNLEYEVRPIMPCDAPGINALRRMPEVLENILGLPSERLSKAEALIASLDGNSHWLVAVTRDSSGNELVIGSAQLAIPSNPRRRHCGLLGICVHRDYQGMGVGTRLMSELLNIADNWLMLKRIELDLYSDNARAIALYRRFGFENEGVKRMASIQNGRYADEDIMARINPVI